MAYLFDSNCFIRLAQENSPQRQVVLNAVRTLRANNEALYYTPQVLAEFWNVCTRPASVRGGLGLSIEQTERKVTLIEKHFWLLADNASTLSEWRKLVFDFRVVGVQVHDAKLVASMMAYNIPHLVSFNQRDFHRFPITVLSPDAI